MNEGSLDWEQRVARNQNLWREVNERVDKLSPPPESRFKSHLCECASTDCVEEIPMTQLEYEEVRRRPNHFFVKPGHVLPDIERVVDQAGANGDRYQVVEKFGEAGKVAVRLDPRQSDTD